MDTSLGILSDITVYSKYAKYLPNSNRRETWAELVERRKNMDLKKYPLLKAEIEQVYKDYVLTKKVLPSMRSMQFAGKPIEVNPSRIFNCSYAPVDHYKTFQEAMFLLLGGTGFGYSVQSRHVDKLPDIRKPVKSRRYLIADSIEGWADAVGKLMKAYFTGGVCPEFDFSDIREKGAELVTTGGKAPGPEPLKVCLAKIKELLNSKADNTKLAPLECHDIICLIADAVLAGGIRRAACICLFDLDDQAMIECKSDQRVTLLSIESRMNGVSEVVVEESSTGKQYRVFLSEAELETLSKRSTVLWYHLHPHRGRANNSAVIVRHKVKKRDFKKLWKDIEKSGSGEPGLYLTNNADMGTNPCCEIALKPYQFCNLVEINASTLSSQQDLDDRTRAATFIATLQAGYTNFHYLRDVWRKTTEKDALLGVSMTGICSGAVNSLDLTQAANLAVEENKRLAKIIGINSAARITCVKPAGTTSLVLGTSSGIHAWHSPYYLRRIRVGKNESLYKYLAAKHPSLVEDEYFSPATQAVIQVPVKAPEGAIFRDESALDLLGRVKRFSLEWIQPAHIKGDNSHNVSATVSVKPDEWESVGEWMWENRSVYNGLSVLPYDGGTYIQAPFEDITEDRYNELVKDLNSIDLSKIVETEDTTDAKGEIACGGGGGSCELNF